MPYDNYYQQLLSDDSRAPASDQPQTLDLGSRFRQLKSIKDADAQSVNKLGLLRSLAEQQNQANEVKAMADQTAQRETQTDLSPLMALADSWGGTNLSKNYNPFTPEKKMEQLAALRKLAASTQEDVTKTALGASNSENRQDNAMMALLARMAGGDAKHQKEIDKQFTDFDKALDPNVNRAGEFGKQAAMNYAANRVLTIGQQFADGNPPKNYMADTGTAVAALVSNGGHAAEQTISRFIPDTKGSLKAAVVQWFTDHPEPADQQEFFKAFMDTAAREKANALNNIKDIQLSRIPNYEHLRREDSGKFQAIMKARGVDPQEFEDYVANGYKRKSEEALGSAGTGGIIGISKPPAGGQSIAEGLLEELKKRQEKKGKANGSK